MQRTVPQTHEAVQRLGGSLCSRRSPHVSNTQAPPCGDAGGQLGEPRRGLFSEAHFVGPWLACYVHTCRPGDESWDWIPAEEGAGRSRLVTVHQRRGQWQNEMAPSTTGRIQRITKEDHYRCWHCVPPGAGRHGWPRQDNGCHRSQGRAAGAAGRICKTDTYDEPRRGGGLPEGLRPAWPQSLSWNRLSSRTSRDFWVRVRSWLTTWTERTAVN